MTTFGQRKKGGTFGEDGRKKRGIEREIGSVLLQFVSVCVRVCACMSVHVCARACVLVRFCVYVCASVFVFVSQLL